MIFDSNGSKVSEMFLYTGSFCFKLMRLIMVGYAGKSLIVIAMVMFASLKTYFHIVPNQRELGLKRDFFLF